MAKKYINFKIDDLSWAEKLNYLFEVIRISVKSIVEIGGKITAFKRIQYKDNYFSAEIEYEVISERKMDKKIC